MWLIKNTWLFRKLFVFFRKKDPKIKAKINDVKEDYEALIQSYNEVQNKTSNLSRSQRDMVVARVQHLVSKGHIKVG